MTKELQIRPALYSERKNMAALTKESYAEYAPQSDPGFWQMYEKSIEDLLLNSEEVDRIIALHQEQMVGAVIYCQPYSRTIRGRTLNNTRPEMRLLAVSPKQRNLGIAASLIDYCEARAVADGFDAITLHTTKLMQTAKAMYERRGYERFLELDFEPVDGFLVMGYRKSLKA